MASDWPPCDNWDGLGNYGKPVVWTGPLMSIQDVGSVQPGEEQREIEFVLVFHDDERVLGRWDIDYDFVASASANGAGRARGGRRPLRVGVCEWPSGGWPPTRPLTAPGRLVGVRPP